MSDRSRVTVTLGRSGRVVHRTGVLSDGEIGKDMLIAGRKRPIRDRLGGHSEDRNGSHKKWQDGESTGHSIGKDDLRFKLLQKNSESKSQSSKSLDNFDLRDKLSSRNSRPSAVSMKMHPPESAASTRHPLLDPRVGGMSRHPVHESMDTSISRRLPPSSNPSELSAIGPPRSYPSHTMEILRPRSSETLRRRSPESLRRSPEALRRRSPEALRRRSPETVRRRSPETVRRRSPDVLMRRSPERRIPPSTTRGLSPQKTREELQRRPLIRPYDDGRSTSYVVISPPRPVQHPYLTRSLIPAPQAKSVVPASHQPQAVGTLQKIPSSVDVPPTVDSLLQSLGLEKYGIYFKAEEVDMSALRQLSDSDLKDLGIPMGPRKKILQAVMPRARRQL